MYTKSGGGGKELAGDYETNVGECSVIVGSVSVDTFTEAYLELSSTMKTSGFSSEKDKFMPILRVAQIKVTPHEMGQEDTAGK